MQCARRAGFTECWPSFSPAGTRDPMSAFLWEPMQGRVLWGNSCIWRSWPWCPTQRVCVDMCSPGVLQGLDLPFHWAHRISGCENICRDHFVTGPMEVLRLMVDSPHFPGCHLPCALWPCLPSISSGTAALMRVARPRPRTLELYYSTCSKCGPLLQGSPPKILATTVFARGHPR